MLGIFDVTNELTGKQVDTASNLSEAKERIAANGNMGYIYAVRFTEPASQRGIPVASFRVCNREVATR